MEVLVYTIFLYSRHNECRLGKHSSVDVCHGFRNLVLANNTFKESDPLSFTFLPGITYGLTATSSVFAGYYVAFDSVAENGITALTGNQNVIGSFNNPSLQLGTNCCSVPVKLFSSDIQPVPEPSLSLGLLALGTLGAASTLKRKLKSSKSSEKETTKVG